MVGVFCLRQSPQRYMYKNVCVCVLAGELLTPGRAAAVWILGNFILSVQSLNRLFQPQKLLLYVWTTLNFWIFANSTRSRPTSRWCDLTLSEASCYFSKWWYGWALQMCWHLSLKWTLFTYFNFLCDNPVETMWLNDGQVCIQLFLQPISHISMHASNLLLHVTQLWPPTWRYCWARVSWGIKERFWCAICWNSWFL